MDGTLDAMSEILNRPLAYHPLAPVLVAALFSAIFVPQAARIWQDRQRDLDIRTALVTDMSRCIMRFVSDLEYCLWPSTVRARSRDADTLSDSMDLSYRGFDVERCVIGTKLEVYYPKRINGRFIARDWGRLTDLLIDLYRVSPHDAERWALLQKHIREDIALGEGAVEEAQDEAARRAALVDQTWGVQEQLLLAEKLRLITAVRRTRTNGWRKKLDEWRSAQ